MSGLHKLGQQSTVVGAWFSGSDEAHAGIRAVRALQATFADVLKTHPDAAKYAAQVNPVVKAADDWDKALVFYVNDDAVELGRRAEAILVQLSAEYGTASVVHDPMLDRGAIEKAQGAAGAAADTARKIAGIDLPWWVWLAVAVVATAGVGVVVGPPIAAALRAQSLRRAAG